MSDGKAMMNRDIKHYPVPVFPIFPRDEAKIIRLQLKAEGIIPRDIMPRGTIASSSLFNALDAVNC